MTSQGVTLDQIVSEAIAMMKEQGLEQVTLRNLAARLGIKAPSLYWHVENKAVLHERMARSLFMAALEGIPARDTWQDWLMEYGTALWRLHRTVPGFRKLLVLMPVDEEMRIRGRIMVASILDRLGLPLEHASVAIEGVQALVMGWVHLHDSWGSPPEEEAFQRSLNAVIIGWEKLAAESHAASGAQRHS